MKGENMTGKQLIEYAQNPNKVTVTQISEVTLIPVRKRASFIAKTVNSSYVMGIVHAYNRIDINFMAGVDNDVTRQEFKDWLKELGFNIDKQYLD